MENIRSLLFVPGDRPDRMAKAARSGADAIILDLEDSVSADRKARARRAVAEFLERCDAPCRKLVRINPVTSEDADLDLAALAGSSADALVIPKAEGAVTVLALVRKMEEHAFNALLPILPIATETAAAMFELGSFRKVRDHLCAIGWGAEDLPAAIGALSARDEAGRYTPPYELARSLALFAAAASDVPPMDTVYPDIHDAEGLSAYASRAARDGFTGMMAIHPSQVAIINQAFTPSAEEVERACAVMEAFASSPHAGALQLDGKMIDAPHLKQARRIVERSKQTTARTD